MLALNEASGSSRRLKICEGNLALLREKIGREPDSYGAEYAEQLEHFLQQMRLLQLHPQLHRSQLDQLLSLTGFLASTAHRFPESAGQFGQSLMSSLDSAQVAAMDPELRLALCKAAVQLGCSSGGTNKTAAALDLFHLVPLLFQLLRCQDKQLRKYILGSLIAFIRRCTKGSKSKKKNKRRRISKKAQSKGTFGTQASSRLQQLLFSMLDQHAQPVCARVAQMALMEAYRKQYWRDAKIANALAQCVFHPVQRIQVSTMRFFLGSSKDEQGDQESSEDEEEEQKQDSRTLKDVLQQFKHAKKTRKRQKQLVQAKKTICQEKKGKKERGARQCNLEAIRSIYDPQRFADRLFGQLHGRKNEKYALRLLQIALCARVIGVHRLQTLGFYSYMHRYLQPKQKEVTRLLLYAAQACHELVPPDVVEQLVHVIAQNFVSDRNTPEAITVGLNTIREIYTNCPAAANEEMVRDLAEYKQMHNKNVSMAARGLIGHLRQSQPKLLHHRDRGRPPTGDNTSLLPLAHHQSSGAFGELRALDHVPGAEILPEDAAEAEQMAQQLGSDDDDYDDNDDSMEEESDDDEEEKMEEVEVLGDSKQKEEEAVEDEDDVDEDDDSEEEEDELEDEEGEVDDEEDAEMDDDEEEEEEEKVDGEFEEEKKQPVDPEETITTPSATTRLKNKPLRKSQKKAATLAEQQEAKEHAKLVSESRILTDADFQLIRRQQLRQMAGLERGTKRKKTNDEMRLEEELQEKMARNEGDGLPRLNDIEHFHKKMRRQTKEERMEQIQQGREGRPEYGKPKKGAHVGRTNRELAKRKNFQMIRQKMRGKNRQRSFRDRQISLRNYLIRQQGKNV